MTRARALGLTLLVFLLGAAGYGGFKAFGLSGMDSGIAAEALLVVLVLGWTGSYLWRVVSGRMSFMEQRRRYRAAYDNLTNEELKQRFQSLSPAEQEALLREVGQLEP
jgi:hypothetical protein